MVKYAKERAEAAHNAFEGTDDGNALTTWTGAGDATGKSMSSGTFLGSDVMWLCLHAAKECTAEYQPDGQANGAKAKTDLGTLKPFCCGNKAEVNLAKTGPCKWAQNSPRSADGSQTH
ncbi:hypothetical protein ERJ75_001104800 [Trypanosoma vivax]|nr:hypothetical protein ERJ75_001104800 [Trypanosoma vivax]